MTHAGRGDVSGVNTRYGVPFYTVATIDRGTAVRPTVYPKWLCSVINTGLSDTAASELY